MSVDVPIPHARSVEVRANGHSRLARVPTSTRPGFRIPLLCRRPPQHRYQTQLCCHCCLAPLATQPRPRGTGRWPRYRLASAGGGICATGNLHGGCARLEQQPHITTRPASHPGEGCAAKGGQLGACPGDGTGRMRRGDVAEKGPHCEGSD